MKAPLNYTKEDFELLIGKRIMIELIDSPSFRKSEIRSHSIQGVMIGMSLATNPPHLPAHIELLGETLKKINVLKIKKIDLLPE